MPSRTNKDKSILIVEDNKDFAKYLKKILIKEFKVKTCFTLSDALKEVEENFYNLILLDLRLPDGDGEEVIDKVHKISPETFVIVLTAYGGIDDAVSLMKKGIYSYIAKPFEKSKLIKLIKEALNEQEKIYPLFSYRKFLLKNQQFVGNSPQIHKILKKIDQIAGTNIPVFIIGESGTQKEKFAEIIHKSSNYKNSSFLSLNCLSYYKHDNLIEDLSYFLNLNKKATIYFDNIDKLPPALQSIVVDLVIKKKFRRHRVDVRVVASTSLIKEQERKKAIIDDLYVLLTSCTLNIPPLRERKGDIDYFVSQFLKNGKKITKTAMMYLKNYPWFGNILELRSVLEYASLIDNDNIIDIDDLPEKIKEYKSKFLPCLSEREEYLDLREIEKRYIEFILDKFDWNISKTSKILGISRQTLLNKIKKYKLKKQTGKRGPP